jgi:hypothetical protein
MYAGSMPAKWLFARWGGRKSHIEDFQQRTLTLVAI